MYTFFILPIFIYFFFSFSAGFQDLVACTQWPELAPALMATAVAVVVRRRRRRTTPPFQIHRKLRRMVVRQISYTTWTPRYKIP